MKLDPRRTMMGIRIKQYELRIKVFLSCFLLALFLILAALFYNLAFAQTSTCGTTTPARATGLVSAPQLLSGSKFGTTGACIIDPKAAFVPYKIPSFEDLKSLYFDQSKASKVTLSGDQTGGIDLSGTNDKLYHITGNLTLDNPSDITGTRTGVIFIDGNLTIGPISGNRLTHGANTGLVFVVKGKINIAPSVTQIDAVLIGDGIDVNDASCTNNTNGVTCYSICTAYGASCPTTLDTSARQSQLIINGSLISLNQNYPIRFRRTLSYNYRPAEKINHQVKYLVILRDLLSDTYQKWAEIP